MQSSDPADGGLELSTGDKKVVPAPTAIPPVPGQPGCYTHSLKLTSEQTLCQSNMQLCRPEELVGDIKDLAFIGNGSFAAVFKGEPLHAVLDQEGAGSWKQRRTLRLRGRFPNRTLARREGGHQVRGLRQLKLK